MDQKFEAGDVVRLKSGGPKMTVTGENARKAASWGSAVDVCWFSDGAVKPEFTSFPSEALALAEPRKLRPVEADVPGGSRRRGLARRGG